MTPRPPPSYNAHPPQSRITDDVTAVEVVAAIVADLSARPRFGRVWRTTPPDVKAKLLSAWETAVARVLAARRKAGGP